MDLEDKTRIFRALRRGKLEAVESVLRFKRMPQITASGIARVLWKRAHEWNPDVERR